jgi:restriction system protein
MTNEDKRIWGIHTRNDDLFLNNKVVAIGWRELGNLSEIDNNRNAFKKKYIQVFSDDTKGRVSVVAGMLYRFCHEVQIGDYVVFPSKSNREVNIGVIDGNYVYDPNQIEYVQTRKVKWLKHLPRTAFSQGALYEIGSAMTFFEVKNYADEFLAALNNTKKTIEGSDYEDDTVAATTEEIIENTKDFILKELSRNLKGYALEEFIANLLQAMGYRTKVSQQGGDSGIDIIAYKDELPPRIAVQVKSQDSDIKETVIQSLKGAMMPGDYGLFVTLSNYTKNAQQFLKANPIIRGINGTELVDLILKYYSSLEEKYKKMIPLKMVYIPVVEKD